MARREYDAEYRREERAKANAVVVPKMRSPKTRARLETDSCKWLSTMWPRIFTSWTSQRRDLVATIEDVAAHSQFHACAATRGEGKTMIALGVAIKLLITGRVRFILAVAATGPFALRLLGTAKYFIETSEPLLKYYPEVAAPIRALEGIAQRCASQTVNGKRTRMVWAGNHIRFPTVEGSRASAAIIATAGIDGAIRGFNLLGSRPDFILIDDPETRKTAKSIDVTAERIETIDNDIAGTGTGETPAAIVMLNNVINRRCIGAQFTDRKKRPAWRGRRIPLVAAWSERADLWETYRKMRAEEFSKGRSVARLADAFYLKNRRAMDAGHKITNPRRFNSGEAEDGGPIEYSALQAVHNAWCDRGKHYVDAELNCDPPEEVADADASTWTTDFVKSRAVGVPRSELPAWAELITYGVDAGKYFLHWVGVAWSKSGRGHVIDYGTHAVVGTSPEDSDQRGIDLAVRAALVDLARSTLLRPHRIAAGGDMTGDAAFDSGYRPGAAYAAIRELKTARIYPIKGTGDDLTRTERVRVAKRADKFHRLGRNWSINYQRDHGIWLVVADSDHWKQWARDRLATTPDGAGSLTLFAPDAGTYGDHTAFAEHICNEVFDVSRQKWIATKRVHWGDALYYAAVMASIKGVSLFDDTDENDETRPKGWAAKQAAKQRERKTTA